MSKKNSTPKFERTSTVIKCTVVTIAPGRGYDVDEKWCVVGERCAHNSCMHEYMLESLSSGEKLTIYAAHTHLHMPGPFSDQAHYPIQQRKGNIQSGTKTTLN